MNQTTPSTDNKVDKPQEEKNGLWGEAFDRIYDKAIEHSIEMVRMELNVSGLSEETVLAIKRIMLRIEKLKSK